MSCRRTLFKSLPDCRGIPAVGIGVVLLRQHFARPAKAGSGPVPADGGGCVDGNLFSRPHKMKKWQKNSLL
jgi:hypothetical protein